MHGPSLAMGASGALGLVVVAVVFWATVAMNAQDGSRPSSVAGIRTQRTMAGPAAWVAAHRAARPATRVLCLFCAVAAAAMLVTPFVGGGSGDDPNIATIVAFVIGYGGVLVGSLWITRIADRAADAAGGDDGVAGPDGPSHRGPFL